MSVTLCAVGGHGLDIGYYINDRLDELLRDLQKAWPEHPSQKEVPEDLDDRYWHYDIDWYEEERIVGISVNLPLQWQLNIYPKTVEFWVPFSYSALYSWFFPESESHGNGDLRVELFRLMRFLQCEEVIYLPDNNRPTSRYVEVDPCENINYHELKARITQKFSAPMIYPGGVDFTRLEEDYKTAWVVDTFKDLKHTVPEQRIKMYHRNYYEMDKEEWAEYLRKQPDSEN